MQYVCARRKGAGFAGWEMRCEYPAFGKAILRDYINAAVGFGPLSEATDIPAKSLMRMLGPSGNLRAENFFRVLHPLQIREGMHLEVQ